MFSFLHTDDVAYCHNCVEAAFTEDQLKDKKVCQRIQVSIGMNAIPSNQDAQNVWEEAKIHAKSGNVLAILSFPIVVVIYIFNALRVVWADLFYGIAIGVEFPPSYLVSDANRHSISHTGIGAALGTER